MFLPTNAHYHLGVSERKAFTYVEIYGYALVSRAKKDKDNYDNYR